MKGLESLVHLTSLDLSFNRIKHIKNLDHLKELKDLYLVQNKIQKIECLDGLEKLRNLELAANRIRVGEFSTSSADANATVGDREFRKSERVGRALAGQEQNHCHEGTKDDTI